MASAGSQLAAAVRPEQVRALLLARAPAPLDVNSDGWPLYVELVEGVASEVAPFAGVVPEADRTSQRWDLAVWATTIGVALALESAMSPQEDGLALTGLGVALAKRYAAVLDQLRGELPDDANGAPDTGAPPPAGGSFPPPPPDFGPTYGQTPPEYVWPYPSGGHWG